MSCPKCGGTMVGDGYTMLRHCEFARPEDLEGKEADAGPVYCVTLDSGLSDTSKKVLSRFETVETRLAQMGDTLRELIAALGPCGSFDKHGNCGNHFATRPCPVGEADLLLAKMRESAPSSERSGSQELADAFTPLRRTAGNLRLCAAVLPEFQRSTADTMRGFAEEIECWVESMANTGRDARREMEGT